jgi:hypothetical protein
MIVWVLIFYISGGPLVIDNIRAQANCEALATTISADVNALTGTNPPHRCIAVQKR